MIPDKIIRDEFGKTVAFCRERSLPEMVAGLEASLADTERKLTSVSISRASWFGTKNAPEYLHMLRHGFDMGVLGVEGLDGLSSDMQDDYTFIPSVCGTYLDVGAYQAGVPDCMLEYVPEPSENVRGLTLVIDTCYGSNVDSETVLEYARSVMRLVAWLSAERIETAVYIICPIQLNRKKVIYLTPIRRAGDILAPERMAAMVHPSWLRRCWFAMMERDYYDREIVECSACRGSYGHVTYANAKELAQCVPEAYSVIMLPKIGHGDPMRTVQESTTLKLRQE